MNWREALERLRALRPDGGADLARTLIAVGVSILVTAWCASGCWPSRFGADPVPHDPPIYCLNQAQDQGVALCLYGSATDRWRAWSCSLVRWKDSTGQVEEMPPSVPVLADNCLDAFELDFYDPEADWTPWWGTPHRPGPGPSLP